MSGYSALVLADGATAYWKLGETSGTSFADSGANGLTGTSHNTPTLNQTGTVHGEGGAVAFLAGSSQYIDSASSPFLAIDSGGSVEVWVFVTAALNAVIVSRATASNFEWGIEYDKDNSRFIGHVYTSAQGNISTVYSGGSKALSTWYHVVMTWDGNVAHNAELYVNGAVDHAGGQTTPGGTTYTRGTSGIQIARYGNSVQYITARIQEVAVYQTNLTATQVSNHYQAGLGNFTGLPPVAGTTTYTGQVPILAVPTITPPAGTYTFVGLVPTVSGTAVITPPKGAYTLVGLVPSINGDSTITPPVAGTTTYLGLSPTWSEGQSETPPVGAITFAGLAPTILPYQLQTQCTLENNTAGYPWVSGTWGVGSVNGTTQTATLNITVPSLPSGTTASLQITYTQSNASHYTESLSWDGTVFSGTPHTFSGLTSGSSHTLVLSISGSYILPGSIDVTQACLTAQFLSTSITTTAPLTLPTVTYSGLAPAGVNFGPQINPPTGALTYQGFTPTTLINGVLTIPAPLGTYSLVGLGPVVLGTTAAVTILVIPGSVKYSPLQPTIFSNWFPSFFKFISEDYVGYTALDAVPLTSINAGSLLHGQTKVMRFRLGNLSILQSNFILSAKGANSSLVTAVQFSTDNYNWTDILEFDHIKPNGVTDIIFMRITTPEFATIGVGTYLVDVAQSYA